MSNPCNPDACPGVARIADILVDALEEASLHLGGHLLRASQRGDCPRRCAALAATLSLNLCEALCDSVGAPRDLAADMAANVIRRAMAHARDMSSAGQA